MKKLTIAFILFTIALCSTGCNKKQQSIEPQSQIAKSQSEVAIAQSESKTDISAFENRKPFKYTITTDVADFPKWAAKFVDDNRKMITIPVGVINIASGPEYATPGFPYGDYSIKFDVDCDGDGKYEFIGVTKQVNCSYNINSGKHQISMRGDIVALNLCSPAACDDELYSPCFRLGEEDQSQVAVLSVDDWGDLEWRSLQHFASDCYNLNKIPENAPNLKNVIDVSYMFLNTKSLNQPLDHWDVSHIKYMDGMFRGSAFNQPLEHWDVSHVEYMDSMFMGSALSHYPSSWIIPESVNQEDMFSFSGVEKIAEQNPLKTR